MVDDVWSGSEISAMAKGIDRLIVRLGVVCLALAPWYPAVAGYTERYQTWAATADGAWQVQDLSGAPFNVPANGVAEVAILNAADAAERFGGVRRVGSALQRRFQLHEAEDGGADAVVMHVQADAAGRIEHYAESKTDIQFVLLGYWDSGSYVEAFDSFVSPSGGQWKEHNLSAYGVGSGQVAEIVLANAFTNNSRKLGVRRKGSTLERLFDIHEAEGDGLDAITLHVTADATANATIEIQAQSPNQVDFFLVGYWTAAPDGYAYTELFGDIGSPAADGVWQEKNLAAATVPAGAVVELVLSNEDVGSEFQLGARANGSVLGRLLDLHEAEGPGGGGGNNGSDFGRMHVTADAASTIEIYHEDVSAAHAFIATGYWSPAAPPQIVHWREVPNTP